MKKILSLLLCIVLVAGISIAAAERDPWDCPKCGRKGNTGNFCGGCGQPAPEAAPKSTDAPVWNVMYTIYYKDEAGEILHTDTQTLSGRGTATYTLLANDGLVPSGYVLAGADRAEVTVTNGNPEPSRVTFVYRNQAAPNMKAGNSASVTVNGLTGTFDVNVSLDESGAVSAVTLGEASTDLDAAFLNLVKNNEPFLARFVGRSGEIAEGDMDMVTGATTSSRAVLAAVNSVLAAAAPSAQERIAEALPAAIKAGDYVTFGQYEQDNDLSNGQEPIEWLVLEVKDGKALLLSRYGLDAKAYNTEFPAVTWETCSLRGWLNEAFLNAAFSETERKGIRETEVDNSASQCFNEWSTSGGENTRDKIYLLSYGEANKYLGIQLEDWLNMKSCTSTTAYVKAQGAWTSDTYKTKEGEYVCSWWLRSPGHNQSYAAAVGGYGSLIECDVSDASVCVRPALWLDPAVISAGTTEAAPVPVVEQGTWGTCPWTLDANGLLTVGAGVGADTYYKNYASWYSCGSMIKKVSMEPGVILPEKCEFLFDGMENCTAIDLHNVDTGNVTNMDYLFSDCSSLTTLDLGGFDTGNVNSMLFMFSGCSSLTTLDLSGFDTGNVTDMRGMFSGCTSLTALALSGFDTGNVMTMGGMFSRCSSLTMLDLGSFDTGNVTNMQMMFNGCTSLTTLDLGGFDTGNMTNMGGMFSDCTSLTTLDLGSFDTGNVTDMSLMFNGCTSLTTLDLHRFDTGNVTDMCNMFNACTSLTALDLSRFDTGNVTDMSRMFCRTSLTTLDLSSFDTSNVTNMQMMFNGCTSLTTLDLGSFDTGNVTDMRFMFSSCRNLKQIKVGQAFSFKGNTADVLTELPEGTWRSLSDGKTYTAEEIARNRNHIADTYTKQ